MTFRKSCSFSEAICAQLNPVNDISFLIKGAGQPQRKRRQSADINRASQSLILNYGTVGAMPCSRASRCHNQRHGSLSASSLVPDQRRSMLRVKFVMRTQATEEEIREGGGGGRGQVLQSGSSRRIKQQSQSQISQLFCCNQLFLRISWCVELLYACLQQVTQPNRALCA